MFLEKNEAGNITWATISNGMIVVKSDVNDTKAVRRINKLGNEVFESHYASIFGLITGLSVEKNKFEEEVIRVRIEFGPQSNRRVGILTFNLDSSYGRDFMAQIFNVDLSKQIIFTPWSKVFDDGKKRTKLYLSYDRNNKVQFQLPEGTPETKFLETKKGPVVDTASKIAYDDFISERITKFINDNNLVMTSESHQALGEDVNCDELTPEEKSQLVKPRAPRVKSKAVEVESEDDFFNDL